MSKAALRTTARILLVVYILFILEAPVRAADFNSTLDAGKSMGTSSVGNYSPLNLDQTLQNKGLGTASTIAPRTDQASSEKTQYETHYTNPGSLSGASSDVGDFVNSSSQTRAKFNLEQDPTFGNKCLETNAAGDCVKWSGSKDIIKESYPDCETIQVPIYGEAPTEAKCTGMRSQVTMDCLVRTPVRIETEVVETPCSESSTGYKPGQVYAVCKDTYDFFKSYAGNNSWRDDCYCPNTGYLCSNLSSTYILSSPPAGATYLGRQADGPQSCTDADGWDYGNWNIYDWYTKYKNSIIERVYIDYDSSCGDLSRFLEEDSSCRLSRVNQCDPDGNNCLLTVDDGQPTGAVASTQYLTYTASPMPAACESCGIVCTLWGGGWFGGEEYCITWAFQCNPPLPVAGCSGSCPSGAELVSTAANSAVQTGVSYAYSQSAYTASCPGSTFPAVRNVYYADPRVCNSFSGSVENYTMCMDGTNITLSNSVASGTALTQTQQFSTSYLYVRAYGGPDVRSLLNGWHIKSKFECFSESNTCQSLKDQGCTLYAQTCVDSDDPWCSQVEYTYRCGGAGGITGYEITIVCAGEIRCMGSDCKDTSYNANTDFGTAAQASEIMNAVRMDGTDTEIFPGEVRECQSGPKNCCNANTGGVSIAQYIAAMRASYTMYSTLQAGVGATGAATASAAVTAFNTAAVEAGMTAMTVEVVPVAGGQMVVTFATESALGTTTGSVVLSETGAVVGSSGAVSAAAPALGAICTAFTVIGLIIAAYVILTTIYEMAYACTEDDMATSISLGFNLCHKVGTRKDSAVFGFPGKQHDVYCCFSSILARLVHEQGRPQINHGWGSPDTPDCSGFAYGEFAALDFSQMNLTEYMQHVQTKTQMSPEEAQALMQQVQERVENP